MTGTLRACHIDNICEPSYYEHFHVKLVLPRFPANVVLAYNTPITVAARCKSVFALSHAGIVGSNPAQGMDVYVRLFCVYAVLCGLRRADPPSKGSYLLCKRSRN
jgi:hypothetical protein